MWRTLNNWPGAPRAQKKRNRTVPKKERAFTRWKENKNVGTEPFFIGSVPKGVHSRLWTFLGTERIQLERVKYRLHVKFCRSRSSFYPSRSIFFGRVNGPLTPTGNFTLALEHLKGKVLHAFSSIRKQAILNKLNPNAETQILDTMIFSILSYNSEVWGMYTKQHFKKWDRSPIERLHLKFCKRYLEVNNKASNKACRVRARNCAWSLQ